MTKSKLLAKVNAMAAAGKKEIDNPEKGRNCPRFTKKQLDSFKLWSVYYGKKGI